MRPAAPIRSWMPSWEREKQRWVDLYSGSVRASTVHFKCYSAGYAEHNPVPRNTIVSIGMG